MTAGVSNVVIEAGATFELNLTWTDPSGTPIDMTGYTVRSQFRDARTDAVILDVDSSNPVDGITVSALDSTGTVTVTVAYGLTLPLEGNGRYDLVALSPDGVASRLVMGSYTVSPGVTYV